MEVHRAFLCRLIAIHAEKHLDGEFRDLLLTCSLVCREFRAIALPRLFQTVQLTDRRRVRDLYYLTRPIALPSPPLGRPALLKPLQFIRALSISSIEDIDVDEGYASEGTVWISDEPLLAPLLRDIVAQRASRSQRIESISLNTTRPLEWAHCPADLRSLLADVILSGPLSDLVLVGIKGLPRDVLLKAVGCTQDLYLENVSVHKGGWLAGGGGTDMATGLLSMPVPLREVHITTSPGVVPTLTEWLLQSARRFWFGNMKRLALTEIRVGELSCAMTMLERMAASGCVLEILEVSPLPDRLHFTPTSLEGLSFPLEVFSHLLCLNIDFAAVFVDPDCSVMAFEVLHLLFAKVAAAPSHRGSRRLSLGALDVKIDVGIEEDIDYMEELILAGEDSWKKLSAALRRFTAPDLERVNIEIACHVDGQPQTIGAKNIETRLKRHFACLPPSVDLAFQVQWRQA